MILIAHRGNIEGPKPKWENHPDYMKEAIAAGFDVETDIWYIDGEFWFGHDKPQYKVDKLDFPFYNARYWCHAKNPEALVEMNRLEFSKYFWHQEDAYTLVSDGTIWAYPNMPLVKGSICVMPEWNNQEIPDFISGICSDYIVNYKK